MTLELLTYLLAPSVTHLHAISCTSSKDDLNIYDIITLL